MFYTIITNRYATLDEIKNKYSIDEVLDLYELCLVNLHNRSETFSGVKNGR